jgi:hypothetical protein
VLVPFVKLDCGILNSTIWFDRDSRDVFITALLMAEPIEVKEPTPTIKIKTLDPDPFIVPPGWYGFVPSSSIGIIMRTGGLDVAVGLDALERLAAPEAESRSHDHDGRRLVRVDGGFIALNFQKFRDKDYGAADRMRRWREKKKREGGYGVTSAGDAEPLRDGDALRRKVTQAEAEGEGEERVPSSPKVSPTTEGNPARKRAVPRSPFKEPTKKEIHEYAISMGWSAADWSTTGFFLHYATKDWMVGKVRMKDWHLAAQKAHREGWTVKKGGNGVEKLSDEERTERATANQRALDAAREKLARGEGV